MSGLADLVEAMGAGVWMLDGAGTTEYVNPAMARMLGCTADEARGTDFLASVSEADRPAARALLDRPPAGDDQTELELRPRHGPPRSVLASVRPLSSAPSGGPGLLLVVMDITERKQTECALRRIEAHYQVLAEAIDDHLFVISRDDRVDYVNRAAARQVRSVPERIIGRQRTEIFPPDVAERQERSLRHVFDTGTSLYVEGRTLYLEREVWLGTSLSPVTGPSGAVEAVLGLSRDMTEHKRTEDALRASEQRLRVVLANVPLVLWATDADGVATFCAGKALEPLGGRPEDVIGRRFDAIPVDLFPRLQPDLERALAGEDVNRRVEDQALTFETWSAPLRDDHHQITGATGLIVDVTERRKLEMELSNAQKLEAIGRLAGGIAHDFNNHLTAILGYVEMLLEQTDAGAPIAGDLQEIRRAAERAAALVRRLLAFGRRQVLRPRNLDIGVLIEELQPMLGRLIGDIVQVDLRLAPGLPPVTGDPGELEQVIMNLVLNARDAMPGGGTLTIETSLVAPDAPRRPTMPAGAYVRMTVRDTGEGMDAGVSTRVFEPFFTTKPEGQGTGLGLSTVYGIVKQLDGFIWVESAVGAGSVFEVYLPVAVADAAAAPAAAAAPEPARAGTRETILLVEDEHTVRRFARLALERHGFHVLEAATPEEALALATAGDQVLSLLLTDVVMPRINGPELADRVRQVRPELPVLFMSGYPSSIVRQNGVLDASTRLVSKPFTTAELIAGVLEAISTG